MRFVFTIFITVCCVQLNAQQIMTSLVSGDYVLSERINTFNAKTKKPETLTVIERLRIEVKRTKEIVITAVDTKSKFFSTAKGYITDDGRVQFGFTLVRNKMIFSINYDGELTEDGYLRGNLIGIYPTSVAAVKGEWHIKKLDKPKEAMSLNYR